MNSASEEFEVPRGYYFLMRSKLNRLALTLLSSEPASGSEVVTWPEDTDSQIMSRKQLWYYDRMTSTLRHKETDLCLDTAGGHVCVVTYNPRSNTQKMQLCENKVMCITGNHAEQVLEVEKSNLMPRTKIVPFADMGLTNQQWIFVYQPALFFKLRSAASDKILDVFKEEKKPGAKVTVWTDKLDHSANQLWYEDSNGYVRSKVNHFILDSSDGQFKLMPPQEREKSQQWVISNGRILHASSSNTRQVAMIKDKGPFEGARLVTAEFSEGSLAQLWKKEFIS